MQFDYFVQRIKRWLRPGRLLPLLIILGAGIAIVLDLLQRINLTLAENITIALLGLLAVDAFNERLSVLERIEAGLEKLSGEQTLRRRIDMPNPTEHAKKASEICMLAIHGISAIAPYLGFYESKLRSGCKIRIILLDPNSPSIQILNLQAQNPVAKSHIEASLDSLKGLISLPGAKGKCEVRLINSFFSFSIFAVDLTKDSGSMVVEYRSYKVMIDDRPHVYLTKADSSYWFNYYAQQFEKAWKDATVWNPK